MKAVFVLLAMVLGSQSYAEEATQDSDLMQVFAEYKAELKANQDFRKTMRRGRRSEERMSASADAFQSFFEARGIKFGYFKVRQVVNFDIVAVHISLTGGFDNGAIADSGIGPGFGVSSGYEIVACTLSTGNNVRGNFGLTATAVPFFGVWAGAYVGKNGACVRTGAGYGLDFGVSISEIGG